MDSNTYFIIIFIVIFDFLNNIEITHKKYNREKITCKSVDFGVHFSVSCPRQVPNKDKQTFPFAYKLGLNLEKKRGRGEEGRGEGEGQAEIRRDAFKRDKIINLYFS